MTNSKNKFHFLLMLCLGLTVVLSSSCNNDVEGCTNANSDNFNAEATVDDGSCVLAREKFLGSYNVNETCTSGTFTYSITVTESTTAEDAIVINNFGSYNLNVRATVSGENINYNDTQNGITFSGRGSISGNTLTIIYTASQGGQTDNCTKTCIKQ